MQMCLPCAVPSAPLWPMALSPGGVYGACMMVGTRDVAQAASGPHSLTRTHMTKQPLIADLASAHRSALNIAP